MTLPQPPLPPPPPPGRERLLADPQALHPALWRARGAPVAGEGATLPSGFAALDAELPEGGWPRRALTELLLTAPGVGEMRLLAPALARVAQAGRVVMLFAPPLGLCAEALAQLGLPPARCLVIHGRDAGRPAARSATLRRQAGLADVAWALEQALRSGQVGAVLAWLGAAARPEVLRRLQLAAQSHEGLAVLLRETGAAARPSPAPLRLQLSCAGPDQLTLRLLKRRGPLLTRPLSLQLPAVLSPRALARAQSPWPGEAPGPERVPSDRVVVDGLASVAGSAAWLNRLAASA